MKRLIRFLAALLAVLLFAAGLAALAEGKVTTTGSVHLRRGPGLDYSSICTIGEGTRLTYTRTSVDDRGVTWYRVTYDGQSGWVSSMYAREGGSGSEGKVTTTSNVHLRAGAGTDYASRAVIDAGTTLTYDRTAEDDDDVTWYHVSYRNKSGWVSSRYVRKGGGSISGKITTFGDVNLRSGPGLDYASKDAIESGTTLSYDRTSVDDRGVTWYHVSYGGKSGWVSSMYADPGGSGGNRVTTTGSVHLRSGPGLDYSSRLTIDEGVTLSYDRTSVDDRDVTWYHVSYNGKSGWISSVYARKGGGSGSGKKVRMTGDANVRSGPGLDYDSIGTVDEGTSLTYLNKTRVDDRGVKWYKVSYRGDTGWVSSRYARLK